MKLHFNSIIKCAAAIFCGASLFACNDLSELEERVDSLDSRITALETQLPALQDNIDAVQALLGGQIFITEISTNDSGDEYTLKMSDGNSYTIKQGKIGNTPQISVEDGYWIVSYDNGGTFSQVKVNGENVPVTAAPLFRVNADGNWEISTDGKNYETVSDTEGNPVPAVGEGGNFFQNIEYNEESGELSLTLADGKTYSFTVSTDFVCSIVSENNPEPFSPGQTRVFDVKMRGVKDVYLTKPAGWSASLEGEDASDPSTEIIAKLTVTAPETEIETKISADTDTDLVLHAFSAADDRSIYSKIAVAIVIVTEPEVSVSAADVTDASITYTITPNDLVTSWKYIHQLSSEEAPTAESTAWTEGTETTLTIGELEAETAYTLYILPVGNEKNGAIAKCDATTEKAPINDYYAAFMDGQDIEICGKIYNKSQFADDKIKLMENANSSIYNTSGTYGDGTIIFIDIENQEKPVSIGNAGDIIVIGNNPDKKPTVIRSSANLNGEGNKRLVLANLNIDMPNSVDNKGAAVKNGFVANSAFAELTMWNCDILMNETNPLINITSAGRAISSINIEDCKIHIPAGNASRYIASTAGVETTIDNLNFKNNVVYCDNGMVTTFRLVNSQNDQTKTTINNIVFESNTLSNICYNNSAMVIALNINQATITKNLVYFDTDSWSGVTQQYHCILRAYGNYPATANCVDNIAYYDQSIATGVTGNNAGGRYYFRIFQNNSFKPTTGAAEEFELISADPFSGGNIATFTPNSTYSSYGSTIGR